MIIKNHIYIKNGLNKPFLIYNKDVFHIVANSQCGVFLENKHLKKANDINKTIDSIHNIQKGKITKIRKTKEYYQVRLPELNKVPRSYSYEGLIERVYELLFDGNDDDMYTIKNKNVLIGLLNY